MHCPEVNLPVCGSAFLHVPADSEICHDNRNLATAAKNISIMATSNSVYDRIKELLKSRELPFREMQHAAPSSAEEAARLRGVPVEIGGKSLLLKVDGTFAIFVISASLELDSQKVRQALKARKSRFARREELMELTGLVPGSVPPFGRPIFDLDLYIDERLTRQEEIAFSPGSRTHTFFMKMKDYLQLAKPTVLLYARS
jgi:prolyl-tRNA editing enzyme YbaK/EbsC (Cys-tRNA(Pro) deacylase)